MRRIVSFTCGCLALLLWTTQVNADSSRDLVSPGVSQALAQWRATEYSNPRYRLDLQLDADRVRGVVNISLDRKSVSSDLIFDWRQSGSSQRAGTVNGVRVDGKRINDYRVENEHIVIAAGAAAGLQVEVQFDIDVPIEAAGTGLTRYHDQQDNSDYVYSLFVPSDASTVFPCFDQPDLKATFELALSVPPGWSAYSNAALVASDAAPGGRILYTFARSQPISTYVFAFAAGPFEVVRQSELGVRLIARRSQVKRAAEEAEYILRINDAAMRYFEGYFDHRFPFSKYDLILIPEFPYGGMEHAGATFLREDAILFPAPPTDNDRLRRALLLFHETAHQWFGDLVTMRWFDDLWLKEGFANFMAAKAAQAILPESEPWVQFHQRKSEAYRTDVTQGTTAIRQPLENLSFAKSSYGNIVYNKAPAVLRQAETYIGEAAFIEAVRAFTKQFAYGNADWRALVFALERSSGRDLQFWARRWVDGRGVPEIRAQWWHVHGQIAAFRVVSAVSADTQEIWPQRLSVTLTYDGGHRQTQDIMLDRPAVDIPQFIGLPAPDGIVLNDGDFGYGRFLFDSRSLVAALARVSRLPQPLERSLMWESIWEAVREAELDPKVFVHHALLALQSEGNASLHATLLSRTQWAYRHYLSREQQATLAPEIEARLLALLNEARTPSDRLALQRAFIAMARSDDARLVLKAWLRREDLPGDVPLSLRDRYRVVSTLFLSGDVVANEWYTRLAQEPGDGDGNRYGYAAMATRADQANKEQYLKTWLSDSTIAEAWIEEALTTLNAPEHAFLTAPLFEQALQALPRLSRDRKIFFVNRWLEAFVGGQESAQSLHQLRQFAQRSDLTEAMRSKLLEAEDTLSRKVRILETYAHAQ